MPTPRRWLAAVLLLSAVAAQAKPVSCDALAIVDARRLVPLPVEAPEDRFPGEVEVCTVKPTDGTKCEWLHHIDQDRWLPDGTGLSGGTRLIIENRNHILGSGAEDVLYLFRCERGHVRQSYRRAFHYGVTLQAVEAHRLVVKAGLWAESDPNCYPSQQQRIRLTYDRKRKRFVERLLSVEPFPQ